MNPNTGVSKNSPVGFSWTTLLFAFFPALFRGHLLESFIILIVVIFLSLIGLNIMGFIYIKMYIKHSISEGFETVSSSQELEHLQAHPGINLPQIRNPDKHITSE